MESAAYKFILFVAGNEPNSTLARKNLKEICEEYLKDEVDLKIVDVLEDVSLALEHNILLTPALLVLKPGPKIVIAGNLNNRQPVLKVLRVDSSEKT